MSDAVLFNLDYAHVETLPHGGLLRVNVLTTEEDLNIRKGQPCVTGARNDFGFAFARTGKVVHQTRQDARRTALLNDWKNVKLRKVYSSKTEPVWLQTFEVDEDAPLSGVNLLEDLRYSLGMIENQASMLRTVQQQYRHISEEDYETIRQGRFYIARTALGSIGNALPIENRLEFRLRMIRELETESILDLDYKLLLDMLFQYVEERFIRKGHMLRQAVDRAQQEVFPALGQAGMDIYFSDDDAFSGFNSDDARIQATLLSPLLDNFESFYSEVMQEIQQNAESENRFQQIFSRKPFPIMGVAAR